MAQRVFGRDRDDRVACCELEVMHRPVDGSGRARELEMVCDVGGPFVGGGAQLIFERNGNAEV